MRGRIIFLNPATSTGMVVGADRNRYRFRLSDWHGAGAPPRNTEVEFTVQNGEAVALRSLAEAMGEPAIETTKPTEHAPAFSPAPAPSAAAEAITASLLDEDDEISPIDPFGAPLLADPVIVRNSFPTGKVEKSAGEVPVGKLLFTQAGAPASRPSWIFYLIGVGAFLVLLLIGFIVTRFL